jgi:hypothetical protein
MTHNPIGDTVEQLLLQIERTLTTGHPDADVRNERALGLIQAFFAGRTTGRLLLNEHGEPVKRLAQVRDQRGRLTSEQG